MRSCLTKLAKNHAARVPRGAITSGIISIYAGCQRLCFGENLLDSKRQAIHELNIFGIVIAFIGCFLVASLPAYAEEAGATHYPIGVTTVGNGILPPPGDVLFSNYIQFSSLDELVDNSGKKAVPDFHLVALTDAPRISYTLPYAIGPFHYNVGIILPITRLYLNLNGSKGNIFNIGDVDIENNLSYVSKNHKVFILLGVDSFLPTGKYAESNLINSGLNYFTFGPNAQLTYKPIPRLEFGLTVYGQFNTENSATKYHSGSSIDIDYDVIGKPLHNMPAVSIGVQGFIFKQLTDDTVSGLRVAGNGYRGQASAIGPQVEYDFKKVALLVKYQHEFDVRNGPKGDKLWVELAIPLNF